MPEQIAAEEIAKLQDIFDKVSTGVIVLDEAFNIVMINSLAADILNCPDCASSAIKCHHLFCGKDTPCEDCPATTDGPPKPKSYTLEGKKGEKLLIKVLHAKFLDYIILTVNDVTREVTMLRKIDLNRKEAEAKNIIFKRRLQKTQDTQKP